MPNDFLGDPGSRPDLLAEIRRRAMHRRRRRRRLLSAGAAVVVAAVALAVSLLALPGGHNPTSLRVVSGPSTTAPPSTTIPPTTSSDFPAIWSPLPPTTAAPAPPTTVRTPVPDTPPPPTTTPTTTTPTPTPTTAPPPPATAAVPLVVCPTTVGVRTPPVHLPATVTVSSQLAATLAVYTDNRGTMQVVGPRGWSCQAMHAADGSGGVVAYPHGSSVPSSWTAGWSLPAGSSQQAVAVVQTSACSGCTLGQACPLFASAAKAFQTQFGRPCPTARPARESTDQVSAGIVAFADPPGVAGDGLPSGGANPANAAITYHSGNPNGSWKATCTLPSAQKAVCTAALNSFVAMYGKM